MAEITVAVLGTGIMGLPMARNIARAGLDVRVWNRTIEKAAPLRDEENADVVEDPRRAVDGADVVLTILSDADAVLNAVEQADARDAIWLQMSTVGLEGIERCRAVADERGLTLVDAPVLGTKAPAEAGQLTVFAAGPAGALDRCEPILEAVGQKTVRVGDTPGAATRSKLVANHWVLGLVEAVAETIAFAEALGVDPRGWLDSIAGGPLDSAYAQMKGKMILERELDPSFGLAMARKDAGLLVDAAEEHGVDAGLARLVAERMQRAVDAGHGGEDMAATYFATALERGNGRET